MVCGKKCVFFILLVSANCVETGRKISYFNSILALAWCLLKKTEARWELNASQMLSSLLMRETFVQDLETRQLIVR